MLFDPGLLDLELLDFFSRERVRLEDIERLAILGDAGLDTVEASIASTIGKSWGCFKFLRTP
jgi:hypothetical protein